MEEEEGQKFDAEEYDNPLGLMPHYLPVCLHTFPLSDFPHYSILLTECHPVINQICY